MWRRRLGPYLDILKTIRENRDQPVYSWRILRDGVCDGCALGTSGFHDWTMKDVHLCWIRLNLLRLNTMPALDAARLPDVAELSTLDEAGLRRLGRLSRPLLRRRGARRFEVIEWESALELAAARIRSSRPRRLAFYLVSRGTLNETYYAAQKVARFLGTNHVDNSARVCHAASTTGLKQSIGYAATTCSYRDLIGSGLLVFIGSHVANNQPVMMKYIHLAKKQGTRVAVVNPFLEPGMDTYWVPSSWDSALFGTRVCDAFFRVRVGGDIAFLNGAMKHLIDNEWIDREFIERHTVGWRELEQELGRQSFEELEHHSGTSRYKMFEFAKIYASAPGAVLIWSMGITQHSHGTANVRAIANLALARGNVGRPGCGLMPIRGHSGVQGGAEMACVPDLLPGGRAVDGEGVRQMSGHWGFEPPLEPGYSAPQMIEAAHRGDLDVFYCVGSNLLGILPDPAFVRRALERIPLRIHHDIVLNPQMLVEAAEAVLVLPATTRYEVAGGGTETTTERRIVFSPEIPGRRIAEARDEWRTLIDLAQRVRPHEADRIRFSSTAEIRREIARTTPLYAGIEKLAAKGDQFQWGGERLCEGGRFGFEDGRARFAALQPPSREVPEGKFQLLTRRGKQFNSLILGSRDALVGAGRDEVVMAAPDMQKLGLSDGTRVVLRSASGEMPARVRRGPLKTGTVMVYWPEGNVLVGRGRTDPECRIPAYREAVVEVCKP